MFVVVEAAVAGVVAATMKLPMWRRHLQAAQTAADDSSASAHALSHSSLAASAAACF